jgi:hypothetical protein
MSEAVYILCALTSLTCAALLARGYRLRRTRILLWSTWCFIGLSVNNLVLVLDRVVTGPTIDLSVLRAGTGLAAVAVLVLGLVWEER